MCAVVGICTYRTNGFQRGYEGKSKSTSRTESIGALIVILVLTLNTPGGTSGRFVGGLIAPSRRYAKLTMSQSRNRKKIVTRPCSKVSQFIYLHDYVLATVG